MFSSSYGLFTIPNNPWCETLKSPLKEKLRFYVLSNSQSHIGTDPQYLSFVGFDTPSSIDFDIDTLVAIESEYYCGFLSGI